MSSGSPTRVIFLGGLGEIGRNMIVIEAERKLLVIDVGLSFPTEEMPGVDLVLPDFSYVVDRADDCVGIVLTHGHEDHVGALSWFLPEVSAPVYGTALTLGIARRRLEENGVEAEMITIEAPSQRAIGPFLCHFLATSHSIPDSIAVGVDTKQGRILYTSDFKLDEAPIDDRRTDIEGFGALGDEGVDLFLADSTNAETSGRTPSESIVGEALTELVAAAERRVIVACFASNLHRIQQVCDAAEKAGRKIAFVGRSMVANVEVGRELGHLKVADSTILALDALDRHPPDRTVVACTGSQGEPFSALALISAGDHKRVKVAPKDTVILSASAIPGNESAVHRVINRLYRAGADVYNADNSPVHVSGHAAADELRQMLETVKPKHFVPVHGEWRHLAMHARIAQKVGIAPDKISLVEDGNVLELNDGRVTEGQPVQAGIVLVDGLGVGDVGPVVLRDRRHLAEDGILICVVTIDSESGEVVAGPDLLSRGFTYDDNSQKMLEAAADRVAEALDELDDEQALEWGAIKKKCRRTLGEYVWKQTRRRPMILPVVMEV